jgi:hypothetical protein
VRIDISNLDPSASLANTTVDIGGTPMRVLSVDPAQGTVTAVIGTDCHTGTLTVTTQLTRPDVSTSSDSFTVTGEGLPVISGMNPRQADSTTMIALTGEYLDEVVSIRIGSSQQTVIQRYGASRLTFRLPFGVATGNQRISARTKDGQLINSPYQLTVT